MRIAFVGTALFALSLSFSNACSPPEAPPAPGGTGAFGVVTIGRTQKLYLPLDTRGPTGHGTIAVVDVGVNGNGVAGAPALLTDIDLGTADIATTTAADPSVVIAASTKNRTIWFVDPLTDTVTKTIQLDKTFDRSEFSGGGGYVTGIAIDSAHRRAILSVWTGFAIVDLDTQALVKVIEAPPSENFGFDSVHSRIIAPWYGCGHAPLCAQWSGEGLNVIDLHDDTVYRYQGSVGGEPDAAAIDPTTGIAIVPSEANYFQNVIDFSAARFDPAAKTVTAPNQVLSNSSLEGVAIDSTKHIAFWEKEHVNSVAAADLSKSPLAKSYVEAFMPHLPGGAPWWNLGDPHGIAVTTGIRNGEAVGFVVSSDRKWVARIDLKKMLSLPHTSKILGAMDFKTAVTYLDTRAKP